MGTKESSTKVDLHVCRSPVPSPAELPQLLDIGAFFRDATCGPRRLLAGHEFSTTRRTPSRIEIARSLFVTDYLEPLFLPT